MTQELDISKVEACAAWLEESAEGYKSSQSIHWLIDQIGNLSKAMAFVNNQMAIAKLIYNNRKVKAYHALLTSSIANEKYFSATQGKDYISGKLATEQYCFDLCERTSRTITHTMEALRTCISALKEEAKLEGYVNQQNA